MDFVTVSAAVVLLAILLAWYALLEYEDRRRGENSRVPKGVSGEDRRGANRALERHARDHVARTGVRQNGHRPPGGASSAALAGRSLVLSGSYGLAAGGVLVAFALVTLGALLLSFPPLIFLAASVALAFTLAGRGPGLFALVLASLLSDFFFVEPAFVFSMDRQVFRLSLAYMLGGLLSVFISRRLSSRVSA